jgi:branched-subunit amino acid transport protein
VSGTGLIWVVVLAGAGTFLIRFLPLHWQAKSGAKVLSKGRLRKALEAVGPSAVVSLLIASLWAMVDMSTFALDGAPVVAGLAGVLAGKRYLRNIAWATLGGVLAYGAALFGLSLLS